jgi:hypothetical protein
VAALRSFEATYRANLTSHLRSQIEMLEAGRAEPTDPPEAVRDLRPMETTSNGSSPATPTDEPEPAAPVQERDDAPTLGGGTTTSNTPRLDALLGDQR